MKRVWRHFLAGLSLLAGGSVIAMACVHDDSTIFVQSVLSPPLVTPGSSCVFTSDPTQTMLPEGTLDVDLKGHEYVAEFLIANQIVARADPTKPSTETSYVSIQGATIRITDSQGNQIGDFTQLASVTIPPSVGTTPGFAPLGLTILDHKTVERADVLDALKGGATRRLITYTRFFGQTLGGISVQSDEYEFPITVCAGCLIRYSSMDIDPNLPSPNCFFALQGAGGGTGAASTLPIPCIFGQDFAVDCSQCLGDTAC
ncbi:MAG: hypothetical protein ACREJ3_13590, partial [Polyangiaceae bacterium]